VKRSGFPKAERLRRSAAIQTVFRKGRKYYEDGIKIFVLPNGCEQNRVVFTFPRGYGNAVARNYSRRLSREAYRLCRQNLATGFDMAVLVFPGKDSFPERKTQLEKLFRKAGLWSEIHE
jgi:ribonuclease P protein component